MSDLDLDAIEARQEMACDPHTVQGTVNAVATLITTDVLVLVAEVRRLSAREQELWDRESLAMRQRDAAEDAITRVRAIDAADAATASRDYGRGYAQALRDVHDALEKTDD